MGQLVEAVQQSLDSEQIASSDVGAARLALRYAELLDLAGDDPDVFKDLGPKLLSTLHELGLTLRGRNGKAREIGPPAGSKIDELRARRERRTGEH